LFSCHAILSLQLIDSLSCSIALFPFFLILFYFIFLLIIMHFSSWIDLSNKKECCLHLYFSSFITLILFWTFILLVMSKQNNNTKIEKELCNKLEKECYIHSVIIASIYNISNSNSVNYIHHTRKSKQKNYGENILFFID